MEEHFGLLCGENTDSCFSDVDCNAVVDLGVFPMLSEDRVREMVEREIKHLPKHDYLSRLRSGDLDLSFRREGLDWIIKAQTHYGFGSMCVWLSVNYLDRFLSVYQLPKGKAWSVQLLAVACLSLAAKLEEINVPSSVDLQVGEPKFVFEAKTIQRMELLVLNTLDWQIQSITPFSFLDYFLIEINGNQMVPNSLITRSLELISSIIKGLDFLGFRPSEIAAAVALSVSSDEKTVPPDFIHVQKDRVEKIIELIRDLSKRKSGIMRSGSESPNGVLEAACLSLSCKSDDITTTFGSCANSSSHNNSPDVKRRKQTPLQNNS